MEGDCADLACACLFTVRQCPCSFSLPSSLSVCSSLSLSECNTEYLHTRRDSRKEVGEKRSTGHHLLGQQARETR